MSFLGSIFNKNTSDELEKESVWRDLNSKGIVDSIKSSEENEYFLIFKNVNIFTSKT